MKTNFTTFALAFKLRAKAAMVLIAMLCCATGAWAQETLTVYDGTDDNSYLPFYGLYADTQGAASEYVIPSDQLEDMTGGTITAMKFYLKTPAQAAWTGTHQVYIGEVDATTLTGITGPSSFTVVKTASFDATGSELTVTFDVPYTYGGGNLLIGTYVSVKGNYKSAYFYGVNQSIDTGWRRTSASSSGNAERFIPKTTFTYEPAPTSPCGKPDELMAIGEPIDTRFSFEIVGGSGLYNIELKAGSGDWTNWEYEWEETTVNLTGLTPETAYQVRVQIVCTDMTDPETGDAITSGWKTLNFTTVATNAVPRNLAASGITATTATVNWTGYSSDSYNVSLGVFDAEHSLNVNEDFSSNSIPTEWTNDATYPWTVLHDGDDDTGNYYMQSSNAGVASSTSAISVTAFYATDGTIAFKAECRGEGTNTFYDHCDFKIDDQRVFYHGSDLTYDGWNNYSFEVPAGTHTFTWSYTKDSSVNNDGDYFAVDNVVMNAGAISWNTPVSTEQEEYTFEGLIPESQYYVKVEGIKDNVPSGDSNPMTFTTNNNFVLKDGINISASGLTNCTGKTCNVSYTRSFTENTTSTVCLPFAYTKQDGDGSFYEFTNITKEGGEYVATMTEPGTSTLEANKPDLFTPAASSVTFTGTIASVPATFTAGETTSNGWTFKGTFENIEWVTAPVGTYGFSAQNQDGISQGQFVKVGNYVRIKPLRCYLENASFAGARGSNRAAEQLPETIKVRLISANGEVTGIGTISTKTGEGTMDKDAWYSLDGRRVKNPTKGMYIKRSAEGRLQGKNGQKIVIK